VRLDRALRGVPRRVAITGTRGKSGVTRLVAAGLRAAGARVLAKTTGSKPVLIFPDGSEREIARPGPASVREQVRLVALAAAVGADTLVAEMMSIGAEGLAVESGRILRPKTLAVTNVRLDHLDEMGRDRAAIARTLAAAVPPHADVYIPAEEADPAFAAAAARTGSRLLRVAGSEAGEGVGGADGLPFGEFEPNRRLARAVLESLGVDGPTVERGFAAAVSDAGALRLWRGAFGQPPRQAVCISLFAANEPESSAAALRQVRAAVSIGGRPLVGLLSLREDRGDRTLQWVRAAGEGFFREFSAVVLVGPTARAALRKIHRRAGGTGPVFSMIDGRTVRSPEALKARAVSRTAGEPVIVGLGNFVGAGEALVRYWADKGTEHGC
jgi:poly-gamma-glutamate synthase PgsB/CapB